MVNLKIKRVSEKPILAAVCLGASLLGYFLGNQQTVTQASPSLSLQQSDEKVIEKYKYSNEPFEISNLRVKNTELILQQKFSANVLTEKGGGQIEDWLESLEFKITNKSDKRIVYLALSLDFPETQADGPEMAFTISRGIHPKATGEILKNSVPFLLEAKQEFTLTLTTQQLTSLKNFLARRNFKLVELSRMVIRITSIAFEDGTTWAQGDFYKPNPFAPLGYEKINQVNQ